MTGARNRNRTGTLVLPKRRILSPLCLPISPPGRIFGGGGRNRTGVYGFAIRCITILLPRRTANQQLEMIEGKLNAFPRIWSGRRVSNSRPQPWQGCALPTELLPQNELRIIGIFEFLSIISHNFT